MDRHILVMTNPDGTKTELYTNTELSKVIMEHQRIASDVIHQMAQQRGEKLEIVSEYDDDWKNIANGWKEKCLTHIETLTKIAEMVSRSDDVENTMELIKAELTKANFIKA